MNPSGTGGGTSAFGTPAAGTAATSARASPYDHLLDIEPDPQAQLEFQDFVLSSAEADLIAGKVSSPATKSKAGAAGGAGSGAGADNFGFSAAAPTSAAGAQQSQQQQQQQQQQGQQASPTGAFWALEYWAHYFRVDSNDVGNRILSSLMPTKSFVDTIGDNPDFYGPFWIPTTVIFALFATSTMAESIAKAWSNKPYTYDMTLLTYASGTVYTYVVLLPAIVWGIAKYYKIESIKLFDMINVFGYGMFIWIPVALVCVIQSDLLRWVLVLAALGLTSVFHVVNIHKLASQGAHPQATTLLIGIVVVSQIVIAFIFKFQFFQHTIILPAAGATNGGSSNGTNPAI
ncbi:hypothetical protein BC831DRAFT_458868 [Entophlyctis helioformis]|nr:hypothetical protein BC831DRAFT_458868 [Entophlyctis helioformis]